MLIGNKYKIESSELSVNLVEIRINKETGNTTEKTIGYYRDLKGALNNLIDREVRETELKELSTVVAKIDELKSYIECYLDTLI